MSIQTVEVSEDGKKRLQASGFTLGHPPKMNWYIVARKTDNPNETFQTFQAWYNPAFNNPYIVGGGYIGCPSCDYDAPEKVVAWMELPGVMNLLPAPSEGGMTPEEENLYNQYLREAALEPGAVMEHGPLSPHRLKLEGRKTLEQCMDEVAISSGYKSWDDAYNWIAREGQIPSVVAQLVESAMKDAAKRFASQPPRRESLTGRFEVKEIENPQGDIYVTYVNGDNERLLFLCDELEEAYELAGTLNEICGIDDELQDVEFEEDETAESNRVNEYIDKALEHAQTLGYSGAFDYPTKFEDDMNSGKSPEQSAEEYLIDLRNKPLTPPQP